MKPRYDLTGQKFNRLKVVSFHEIKNRKSYWNCICECGNKTIVRSDQLKSNRAKSCGCLNLEKLKEGRNHTHGYSKTRLYRTYHGMKGRCLNPNNADYKDYGGRGIKICDVWLDDFLNFRKWALKSGYTDELTIERINVNGNYEPDNCKWVTRKVQSRNTRQNRMITIGKQRKCLTDWCEHFNISRATVKDRLRNGWSEVEALKVPVGGQR